MRILAIETSCDETAIAIADFNGIKSKPKIRILSNLISSQVKVHQKFGGVVPNLAKREHQKNLVPLLLKALRETELSEVSSKKQEVRKRTKVLTTNYLLLTTILSREPELLAQFIKRILPLTPPKIDAIAVTYGPGLAPALWVGVNFARALSYLWRVPLIPIDHMAGHLYSTLIPRVASSKKQVARIKTKRPLTTNYLLLTTIRFPAVALLVSGGHTELVLMREHGKYKIIGETRDDAAGEAFDKVARLMGLPYPGGPQISALAEFAQKHTNTITQKNAEFFRRHSASSQRTSAQELKLPRPMIHSNDYDFSFSGLKTAVLYMLRDMKPAEIRRLRPAITKEFQDAVVDVLVKKTLRAAKEYRAKTVLLGGGVAANQELRRRLRETLQRESLHVSCLMSHVALSGDNALMIALAAFFTGKKADWKKVEADANLKLSQ